jgi:hypothetical protein
MSEQQPTAAEKLRRDVQTKIATLIADFAAGKISSEQFDIVYSRYNGQLSLAEQALDLAESGTNFNPVNTIDILHATKGRAVGLSLYHHRSGTTLETLGTFQIPPEVVAPVLNDFSLRIEGRQFIEPVQRRLAGNQWVVFLARDFTTMTILFSNEPSKLQLRQMQRLHHDFEEANRRFLDKYTVNPGQLARPFVGFIKTPSGG